MYLSVRNEKKAQLLLSYLVAVRVSVWSDWPLLLHPSDSAPSLLSCASPAAHACSYVRAHLPTAARQHVGKEIMTSTATAEAKHHSKNMSTERGDVERRGVQRRDGWGVLP